MYFSHQSSGGRGEYEIAGHSGNLGATDLDDHQIYLNLGDLGVKSTGLVVRHQGGKWRLRSLEKGKSPLIQRQIGSILLLPNSTRDRREISNGLPVIIERKYTIDKIDFDISKRSDGIVEVIPKTLTLTSSPVGSLDPLTETIDFQSRLKRIMAVSDLVDRLPANVASALQDHAAALESPSIGTTSEAATKRLMKSANDELSQVYLPGTDPLPTLESFLGIASTTPIDPTQVPADEIEIRRRLTAHLRMQKARGAGATKFRKAVQNAYDYRCVFCGLRLPANSVYGLPGVDAAHILPWAKYDVDVVQNGVILCKVHHWAFDQQVLILTYSKGLYSVSMPKRIQEAFESDSGTLQELARHVGLIDAGLLPANVGMRPRPEFLDELYKIVPPDKA